MQEVTKEQFYTEIREKRLDVCYSPKGNYPFGGEFKFKNGVQWGIVKATERDPKKYPNYPFYEVKYYINR